ncbi:MAG: PilZ domain-containing protein [Oligoflexia bacterium]|nr:PilZ domain-containing protein [Oligoflexia bacterium]
MTDEVINFTKKRNETIEQRRREFERMVFQNFLGVYTHMDEESGNTLPIELVDISEKGCLFQIAVNVNSMTGHEIYKNLKKRTSADLKIYFTKKSYIPIAVSIKYCKEYVDVEGINYLKFGCEFDKTPQTFEAMEYFIKFIYKFAEHASTDRGENRVHHLK